MDDGLLIGLVTVYLLGLFTPWIVKAVLEYMGYEKKVQAVKKKGFLQRLFKK